MARDSGLLVTTGSGDPVHVLRDDGAVILAKSGSNRVIGISSSVDFDGALDYNSLTNQGVIASGMFRIPMYNSASEGDITVLNSLAASPSSYNGYSFYMSSSSGLTKGAIANGGSVAVSNDAAQYFAKGATMYFCRNGNWFTDNLATVAPAGIQFSRQILALFDAGDTDYDIAATTVPVWAGGDLEFSSSLSEHGDGWGALKPGEPSWTYNTHRRIGPVNYAAGDTDYDIAATSVPTWAGGDLEFSSSLSEHGEGWSVLKPGEPSWTYNTHRRIGPVNYAAGDTDYDIAATSVPTWAGGDLEFSSSIGETDAGWSN